MRELCSVIWMAYKDLRHDARMTICLVLTVASIALPLLLFFGLKNGVVQVMRQRMINDPTYMEIILQGSVKLNKAWFEEWSANDLVAFLVPKTRELGVSGTFQKVNEGKKIKADMQPTAKGDWLLKSYGTSIPEGDNCILSTSLAQKLNIQKNDSIEVFISRQRKGGGIESVSRALQVIDILPLQASGRDIAYVPLEILERMEEFRDGFGVEIYDWPGDKSLAYPVFYSALLLTKEKLDPILEARIKQRTGFIKLSQIENIDDFLAYELSTGNNPISAFKLKDLQNVLRGKNTILIPHGGKNQEDIEVSLSNQANTLDLTLNTTPYWESDNFHLKNYPQNLGDILPQQSLKNWKDLEHSPAYIITSNNNASMFKENPTNSNFILPNGEEINLSLTVVGDNNVPDNLAYVSPGLIGKLNLLFERELEAGANAQNEVEMMLGRQDYSRFRMYAKSLDDVATLAKQLESSGLTIKTKAAEIERVKLMDHYLTLIIGLITGAAVIGGTICLLASLYASVERKSRSLAVLRLLGIHGSSLCAFPLTASISITTLGFSLALLLHFGGSTYINYVAEDFTLPGEILSYLSLEHQLLALGLAIIASIVAGLAASVRLLRIEASDGLRDE